MPIYAVSMHFIQCRLLNWIFELSLAKGYQMKVREIIAISDEWKVGGGGGGGGGAA